MQSNHPNRDEDYDPEDEMRFQKIQAGLLKLESTVDEIWIRHTESELTLVKTVADGTYDGDKIIMMQISGTASAKVKRKVFRNHLRYCVDATHANIARFVGGSNPSALERYPFVLLRDNLGMDHEDFLRTNTSTKALFTFLQGVERGTRFIYDYGVKHRDCIMVSPSGDPVVYPSGIFRSKFSGRNSTKRSVNHFMRDVGRSNPALPLQGIYELLCAAVTKSQRNAIEAALIGADSDPISELTLWDIADSLKLPLTRQLHYRGSEPDFTLSVGDSGYLEPDPFVGDLNSEKALIEFRTWKEAKRTSDRLTAWKKTLSSRALRLEVAIPYFLDHDFPLRSGFSNGWLRYDDVLKKVKGDRTDMCLLYATERSNPPSSINDPDGVEAQVVEPLFTVESICVRLRFTVPESGSLPRSMYFHRRPDPNAPPHQYWGFISDSEDPLVAPSPKVQEISLRYEMHIQTTMQGDSWYGRANAYVDGKISQLPGAFVPQTMS